MKRLILLISFILSGCFLSAELAARETDLRPSGWEQACRDLIVAGRFDEANGLGFAVLEKGVSPQRVKQAFHSALWVLASQPSGADCQSVERRAKSALYPLPAMAKDRKMTPASLRASLNKVIPYVLTDEERQMPVSTSSSVPSGFRTLLGAAVSGGNRCMAEFLLRQGANPRLGTPSAMQMARNPRFDMDPQIRALLLSRQSAAGKLVRELQNLFMSRPVR